MTIDTTSCFTNIDSQVCRPLNFANHLDDCHQLAQVTGNADVKVLAETLDEANGKILDHNRSPARKVGEIDNRGTHFYLALYWAQALAARDNSSALAARFKPLADKLSANEARIYKELIDAQGKPQDLGGYYQPDDARTSAAMRPSATLNAALASLRT
jgi:isocitrate dehydrogenase